MLGSLLSRVRAGRLLLVPWSLRPQGVDFAQQNRRSARWAISINPAGLDREKVFLFFLDLASAQRGLFRRCSQQGAQNGPPSPCYAYCRSRGGCRLLATAEGWLRRGSVRPPD